MKICNIISIVVLCLGLAACGPNVFYIPIDNKLGNAKPLSKTEDTIRVIVPERITQHLAKARANGVGWLNDAKLAHYIAFAKIQTDDVLQASGYSLTDAGLDGGDDGKSKPIEWIDSQDNVHKEMTKGGKPNVIAMVDSGVLKTYQQTYTWRVPTATDPSTGQPTMWDVKGETVTMNLIYYKIKIVRPIGKDNPLFTCNNSSLSLKFCVYPEGKNYSYETIFEGYGTMDTNANSPAYILNHLASSVLYQYPTLLGKKRVYQESRPAIVITKVIDAPAEKK